MREIGIDAQSVRFSRSLADLHDRWLWTPHTGLGFTGPCNADPSGCDRQQEVFPCP